LGNGFPHAQSSMGKREMKLREKGMYLEDVGYAAIYTRVGLIGLICYCLLFFRIVKQTVSKSIAYVKLWMIYLILVNIGGSWIFVETIVICICLYILEYDNVIKNQRQNFHDNQKHFSV
jgi:hypothetical protein